MSLDLFEDIGIPEDKLHPKFKFLRDKDFFEGERKIISSWVKGFIDRDNKIVQEFQKTFHSSFWEFYLFRVFSEMGFEIDFSKDRPDFIIQKPIKLFIEAVVSNIKQSGRPESDRNIDDVLSMIVPPHLQENFEADLDEAIVRNSNAILGKSRKYLDQYRNCDWVDEQTPFIIALSSYDQVNYGKEYLYPMMALLYGLYFNPEKDDYEDKTHIIKPNTDSKIPLGLFQDNSFKHISAIIFSSNTTLGKLTSLSVSANNSPMQQQRVINIREDYEPPYYKIQDVHRDNPEELSDGLFVFHNPFASNKLSKEVFKASNALQINFDEQGFNAEGNNLPIYSRFNMNKLFLPDIALQLIFKDFNPDWA